MSAAARVWMCLLASTAGLGIAACGSNSSSSGSSRSGAQIFNSAGCATCHTLAAAHSSGTVGPALDHPKLSVAGVENRVRQGGGGMPSFQGQLSDAEIRAVAEFVSNSSSG